MNPIVTPATFYFGDPTDIVQDFSVYPSGSITLSVPPGANFLFLTPNDSYFADNADPDSDFGAALFVEPPCSPQSACACGFSGTINREATAHHSGAQFTLSGTARCRSCCAQGGGCPPCPTPIPARWRVILYRVTGATGGGQTLTPISNCPPCGTPGSPACPYAVGTTVTCDASTTVTACEENSLCRCAANPCTAPPRPCAAANPPCAPAPCAEVPDCASSYAFKVEVADNSGCGCFSNPAERPFSSIEAAYLPKIGGTFGSCPTEGPTLDCQSCDGIEGITSRLASDDPIEYWVSVPRGGTTQAAQVKVTPASASNGIRIRQAISNLAVASVAPDCLDGTTPDVIVGGPSQDTTGVLLQLTVDQKPGDASCDLQSPDPVVLHQAKIAVYEPRSIDGLALFQRVRRTALPVPSEPEPAEISNLVDYVNGILAQSHVSIVNPAIGDIEFDYDSPARCTALGCGDGDSRLDITESPEFDTAEVELLAGTVGPTPERDPVVHFVEEFDCGPGSCSPVAVTKFRRRSDNNRFESHVFIAHQLAATALSACCRRSVTAHEVAHAIGRSDVGHELAPNDPRLLMLWYSNCVDQQVGCPAPCMIRKHDWDTLNASAQKVSDHD